MKQDNEGNLSKNIVPLPFSVLFLDRPIISPLGLLGIRVNIDVWQRLITVAISSNIRCCCFYRCQ